GGRDRYGLLHGGSSFDLERINPHAANGNGRGGGTAVFKFYELRDNLCNMNTGLLWLAPR
ncbi:MAG: hypothetical protein ACXVHK_28040, partial [Solirubrobacteraceae bacterium]